MNDVTPSKIAQKYVLERIANALEDIANHFTQAAAPSDEYDRGRAAEVLAAAEQHATVGSTEHHILLAAYGYADSHPEWFAASLIDDPAAMLQRAAGFATEYGEQLARHTLKAAAYIAMWHPDWFGGAA